MKSNFLAIIRYACCFKPTGGSRLTHRLLRFGSLIALMYLSATGLRAAGPSDPDARFPTGRVADMTADMEKGFHAPPVQVGPWSYWRWPWKYAHLITKQGITDDLEAMRAQGMGGVMLDTTGEQQPHKDAPAYMSKAWLDLIAHARNETRRLGLGFYIHACDGWANAGGPWIQPEDAMKVYTFSKTQILGNTRFDGKLPIPDASLQKQHEYIDKHMGDMRIKQDPFYQDVAVLAYDRSNPNAVPDGVINLTDKMTKDGRLKWQAPAGGEWTILRFGWKITGSINSPASPAGTGLECDKLGRRGLDAHFKGIEPILKILETPKGSTPSYIGVDSWEAGEQNWTQSMPEEFKAAKGYDLIPWLPVLVGDSLTPAAGRFQTDFKDMIQQMVRSNFIGYLTEKMHERGIRTMCESIPEAADIPSGEYWAVSEADKKYGPEANTFPDDAPRAFATLTAIGAGPLGRGWGKNVIAAETFTARSQNWERTPFVQKSGIDWALCAGINHTNFHLYAIQPDTKLKPHYMEHGTGVNRNLPWWNQAHVWFDYIARAQFMLRRGHHVSDVCFVGNSHNLWTKIFDTYPIHYRYDFAPWHRFVKDMTVKDGKAVFPEGASYWLIILENRDDMHLDEMRKIEQMVNEGAAILAPQRPKHSRGMGGFPNDDAEIAAIADRLWGPGRMGSRQIGKGIFMWGFDSYKGLETVKHVGDFNYKLETPKEIQTMAIIARSYIKRLRHHPSILMWCGGNELYEFGDKAIVPDNHPMIRCMKDVVNSEDPGRRFVTASPSGINIWGGLDNFGKGVNWDTHGPWTLPFTENDKTMTAVQNYWNLDDALMHSEVGVPGAASAEIIIKYKGNFDVLPANQDNPLWNRFSWWIDWNEYVNEHNGNPIDNLENYVNWSQDRQAKGLSIALEACKKRFPNCGGFIIWMGHDSFPCTANTSIIDFDGNPKPAAMAVSKIWKTNYEGN